MKIRKLLKFKGYTVDERLWEFRKAGWKGVYPDLEWVSFDSEIGQKLLAEYLACEAGIRERKRV
jgi:hypothetical protein